MLCVLQMESNREFEEQIQAPHLQTALTHLSFQCDNEKMMVITHWILDEISPRVRPCTASEQSCVWLVGWLVFEHTMPFADFLLWFFKGNCFLHYHPLLEEKWMSAMGFKMYSAEPEAWEWRFQGKLERGETLVMGNPVACCSCFWSSSTGTFSAPCSPSAAASAAWCWNGENGIGLGIGEKFL